MPATVAAADEPRPRASGISLRIVDPPADALRQLAAGLDERRLETTHEAVVAVLASSSRPSPSTVSSISPRLQPRTSSSTRLAMASATPRQS